MRCGGGGTAGHAIQGFGGGSGADAHYGTGVGRVGDGGVRRVADLKIFLEGME